MIVVDTGNGLTFDGNSLTIAITDNLSFDNGKLDVSPTAFATGDETAAYVLTDKAVSPHGLGHVRGIANGIAPLDDDTLIDLDYLPKIPANKLKTVPVPWVSGELNFDESSNFTYTHTGSGTELLLGAPQTTGYVGDSGFIYVTNTNRAPLTGIDSAIWKPASYTWYDVDKQDVGIESDVLISYYIAADNVVIYTASGFN